MYFEGHVWQSDSFWACSLNLNINKWDEHLNWSDNPVVGGIIRMWMAYLIAYLSASSTKSDKIKV